MNQAESICNSIYENPDEWGTSGEYRFNHHPSGLSLWIGNGPTFLGSDGASVQVKLGLFGKLQVWRAYKWWLDWNVDRKLNQKRLPEGRNE